VVDKVEVVRSSRFRRAKLYYLRSLRGKAARLREVETEEDKAIRKDYPSTHRDLTGCGRVVLSCAFGRLALRTIRTGVAAAAE